MIIPTIIMIMIIIVTIIINIIIVIIYYRYHHQKNESELVKLAMPVIPMLDDYAWTDPLSMTKLALMILMRRRGEGMLTLKVLILMT